MAKTPVKRGNRADTERLLESVLTRLDEQILAQRPENRFPNGLGYISVSLKVSSIELEIVLADVEGAEDQVVPEFSPNIAEPALKMS